MTTEASSPRSSLSRHRVIIRGSLKAAASATAVVGLYFIGPLDELRRVPLWLALAIGVVLLVGISAWQLGAIVRSPYAALRAVEALAITAPLYLILFAATYYLMSLDNPANFSEDGLTRMDTLYFAVTVFATVGFGDISAVSQTARVLVTVQMVLNLLVLGAGIRVFVGAVERSRKAQTVPRAEPTEGS